jgi:hypothetical protein
MVINLESSMFMPGVASLHIEHSYVVTSGGFRMLTPQDHLTPYMPSLTGGRRVE